MVSRTARYPARHGIPHGTVSRTARHPARHGIPHGTAHIAIVIENCMTRLTADLDEESSTPALIAMSYENLKARSALRPKP
jgi:hypothetical protein